MQQTTNNKIKLLLGCGLCLSLLQLSAGSRAQGSGAPDSAKKQASGAVVPPSTPAASATDAAQTPEQIAELPLLLLVVQRPVGAPARRDDANAALSLMLRSSLRESRKFQVVLYSPEQPSIRRALLEHSIAATDLVEPIKAESLQKLAHLIGAKYVLIISSNLDKAGLKTDVRLQEDMGLDGSPESWITPHSEPIAVDAQFGTLRLKTDQMLALTVEKIDGFLDIPSHLADNIHMSRTRLIGKPTVAKNSKNDAKDKAGKKLKDASSSDDGEQTDGRRLSDSDARLAASRGAAGNTAQRNTQTAAAGNHNDSGAADKKNGATAAVKSSEGGDSGAEQDAEPVAKPTRIAKVDTKKTDVKKPKEKAVAKKTDAKKAEEKKIAKAPAKPTRSVQVAKKDSTPKTDASDAPVRASSGGAGEEQAQETSRNTLATNGQMGRSEVSTRANSPNGRRPAILATDSGAILLTEPRVVSPTPPSDKINNEQAADQYRRKGDLPNSIESLRQAINDNPVDVHLRKKLIVAYQDRQLLDQAVSETERAMQIAPADPDLSRLYANSMTAKGDTAGAIKLLRDIVAANPANTAAQVALGDALLQDSQFADALAAFDIAARNDPKSPLPHRRLARVLAARAGSDTAQYAACLRQIEQARSLTPATDTQTYQGDYFEIMLLIESRLKDMLDQTNETLAGGGRRSASDLMRAAADLKERAGAASDFLDKMPPAAGQDITHAHYQQGAALLAQAVGYLRKYLQNGDMQVSASLSGTRTDALAELSTAHTRLVTARAALEKGRAAIGVSGG